MADLGVINGRYKIQGSPIAQGGMGVVYKAYDTVTKRNVALKTMRGEVSTTALQLFAKEWSVLAGLSHPNIVDILDTGEYEEGSQRKPFFVMPLLPGVTLDQLIKNSDQRLTTERIVEIITQTCRGLQAAHEHGLIHRDIKPSNIFVLDDDAVKIIDFGVAYLADRDSITRPKGTLQYMAPEQIEMKPMSPASDLFSLGVVCYEALTGRKPFARPTDEETAQAILRHNPPPVSEINPAVPQLVTRVVHQALAKSPHYRFGTAREFAETLQKAANNQPIERFDSVRLQPRIERAKRAHAEGDDQFASEILGELEAEGHLAPEMSVLRLQIDHAIRQKSIHQLLDSARTRIDEEEFPLAMQKIQDVLAMDPENADALTMRGGIEKQRSGRQIENWFRLANEHLQQQSFHQARQALEEILKIDANNRKAEQLLVQVEQREQEISKLRAEKEQLYQSAVNAYQLGEISAALSNLERVLDLGRSAPESAVPDRDAQYQTLYNQLRTDRETARNLYNEGRGALADKNFARALEICEEALKKSPGDPLFQALKLEIEEQGRQEQSSFIAEIARRVEAEPDLDRGESILQEAVDRFPSEPQFQRSLRLIRNRRDLLNSIVAKARAYEDRGQFNEALGQFDILRNIYPRYPGLSFETDRLARRRDEQARGQSRGRWVEQIDRQIQAGDYVRAGELVRTAMAEFPDDAELAALQDLSSRSAARAAEAWEWLRRGEKMCSARQYAEGLAVLRKAGELDPQNPVIRSALLNALVDYARVLLVEDWRSAEPLIGEATAINANHPAAKSLRELALDYKRQDIVTEWISRARKLQSVGDLAAALQSVEEALASYPGDGRLTRLRLTLSELTGSAKPAAQANQAALDPGIVTDPALDTPSWATFPLTVPAPSEPAVTAGSPPETARPVPLTEAYSPVRPRAERWVVFVAVAALQAALTALCFLNWSRAGYSRGSVWLLFAAGSLLSGGFWLSRSFVRPGRRNDKVISPPLPESSRRPQDYGTSRGIEAESGSVSSAERHDTSDRTVIFSTRQLQSGAVAESGKAAKRVANEFTGVFIAPPGGTNAPVAEPMAYPYAPKVGLTITNAIDSVFVGRMTDINSVPMVIGRHTTGLNLSFDQAVSGRHAEIGFRDGGFVIRDLSSANGTWVDNRRISGAWEPLFFGARIALGFNTEILFVSTELEDISDLAGTVIDGRYSLIEKLHGSAKSVVYRADDTKLRRPVAIKILSPRLVGHSGYREQFNHDVEIASHLMHANVCRVLDYGDGDLGNGVKTVYVCTEYLEGGSLAQRLDGKERIGMARAGLWLDKLSGALGYLRRADVVHGGIKPSSIIFNSNDEPSLTDFAFSFKAGSRSSQIVVGSPSYMAPEQWDSHAKLEPATDQYSLAATIYRLTTGSVPHEGQEHPQVRQRNFLRCPIPAHIMAEHNGYPPVPIEISEVLERAMSRKPEGRYSSAEEFSRSFRLALAMAEKAPRAIGTEPASTDSNRVRSSIFVSYSHRDSKWLEKLKIMLKPLDRAGLMELWDDSRIKPGEKWKEEIQSAIAHAEVAILLVSPHFLASDFITKNELPPILEASEKKGGLRILWVPLSHCLVSATPIHHYHAAWNPDRPLAELRGAAVQKALATIAKKVEQALGAA
jgi:serine/threonine protein kinase/pSer/pThr/pTyr-binding forkhead associated (FHA) protein